MSKRSESGTDPELTQVQYGIDLRYRGDLNTGSIRNWYETDPEFIRIGDLSDIDLINSELIITGNDQKLTRLLRN